MERAFPPPGVAAISLAHSLDLSHTGAQDQHVFYMNEIQHVTHSNGSQ